jgi:hypothetical protein
MDRQINIDERLDVLENEVMRLIDGEYAVMHSQNTITYAAPTNETDNNEKED